MDSAFLSPCSGWLQLFVQLLLLLAWLSTASAAVDPAAAAAAAAASTSTNTWVVLASTSRYWFNYRHTANALSIYRIVKAAGVPDSNIHPHAARRLRLPAAQWTARRLHVQQSSQHSLQSLSATMTSRWTIAALQSQWSLCFVC